MFKASKKEDREQPPGCRGFPRKGNGMADVNLYQRKRFPLQMSPQCRAHPPPGGEVAGGGGRSCWWGDYFWRPKKMVNYTGGKYSREGGIGVGRGWPEK